ncbi:hypothetical protein [Mumia sp. Pv 4-285]|uniref:hypothetical protein n=1 Tax=Mumia qirimensis TaxID=3234852 RepID=UPI00351D3D99
MTRGGAHRDDVLPRALRPKRTRAEIATTALLLAGVAVLVAVVLPIASLREYDGALLLAGLALLGGWTIAMTASVRSRPGRPRWELWLGRVATVLIGSGLVLKFVALFQTAYNGRGWWALFIGGGVVYMAGHLLDLFVTRDERAEQRERDREHWEYEHRRREAARAATAQAAATSRADVARIAAYEHRAREAARRAELTPQRTGAGAPDTHP